MMVSFQEPFRALKEVTLCPFAAKAKLVYCSEWAEDECFKENVGRLAAEMGEYVSNDTGKQNAGYVIRVPCPDNTLDFAISVFKEFLSEFAFFDSSSKKSLEQDPAGIGWTFEICYEPMFLNLFSGAYPKEHSKYINDNNSIWILIQPEFIFTAYQVNRSRFDLKKKIREDFLRAGMGYNTEIIDSRRKGLCFVFPAKPGDAPVRWWEY